ncbi:NADP-dependent oxidoreductase [Kribbella albertanoniae]|uniref:NADP-dependent oxidoreductase n=1 Tax=Kribbella albertanoniae TaxID=1266829 RepID=A0A4R4P4A8_9ACTN|nr:NADP-dependent oxidoreductase [Kribbella albertanoniae]TDC17218.1 NADP-dependent oxidoreductase [Kribbella albertanoniae]
MKAIVFAEYGGPEVLRLEDVEEPHAGPGQVRLRVMAAGVNPVDYKIRRGWMPDMAPASFPAILGMEAAGVVDEIGPGVTGVAVGDEVLAPTVTGSYAEYALANDFALKPAGLEWETAAALPVAVETADRVLEILAVKAGETLLVHGAAGVVGAVAVQLAVNRGVTVIGTAAPRNHDYLHSLGASPVTYGDGLADRVRVLAAQGIDAVFDAAGQDALDVSIELRGSTDRIVTITDLRAFDLGIVFSGSARSFGPQLTHYAQLVADNALRVRVAATFNLADAGRAHDLSETGHAGGKVILIP